MSKSLLNPGHCVSNNLHQTARAVSRIYAEEMRPSGLARSQFAILANLNHAGPLALSELADRMYMDRTTLTRNLKPLEKSDLLTRWRSDDDARVTLVAITDKGQRKLAEARRYWRRAQNRLLAMFGKEKWRKLESTLRELRQIVTD